MVKQNLQQLEIVNFKSWNTFGAQSCNMPDLHETDLDDYPSLVPARPQLDQSIKCVPYRQCAPSSQLSDSTHHHPNHPALSLPLHPSPD